jgi:hypothetical protein
MPRQVRPPGSSRFLLAPEAADTLVNPSRRTPLDSRPQIIQPQTRTSAAQAPRRIPAIPDRLRKRSLTRRPRWRPLQIPMAALASSVWSERRRSRYLPSTLRSRTGLTDRPRGGGTEVLPRSASEATSRLQPGVPETRHPLRPSGRHPMPYRCSRHPLSTRSTHRTAVFAFLGSPCALAHELDTALDPRSGADPCERMALRIQT